MMTRKGPFSALLTLALVMPLDCLALPHENFVAGLHSFDAKFEQQVFDENGNLVESSTGTVALTKPNLFRWHYEQPFEQIIVADGRKVWLYDIDLEQVTVKPQDAAEAQSPLAVLTDPAGLESQYELTAGPTVEAVNFMRLTPRFGEGELRYVDLGFTDDMLSALIIQDGFGQRTEVRFSEPCRNRELSSALFQFAPPVGIDVIGEQDIVEVFSQPDGE